MIVVILGIHRSRTSMVSHMCVKMGVHMGDHMLGAHPSQPYGHWEDVGFYELNKCILHDLGGTWRNPPSMQQIKANADRFGDRASALIARRSKHKLWGWKDPRTCITLPVYLPHLTDPVFVFTKRNRQAIIDSLIRRNRSNAGEWNRLIDRYDEGMAWAKSLDVPSITVDTDLMVMGMMRALPEIERLGKFLGVSSMQAKQAIGVVNRLPPSVIRRPG